MTSSAQIFDLKHELPSPQSEDEVHLITMLDQLCKKIKLLINRGYTLPEAELHYIFELHDSALNSPQGGMIYGMILMLLGEANAQNDLMADMIERHGAFPPFYFYKSLALGRLGRHGEALDDIQMVIGAGVRHFEIYMQAARWKLVTKDFRGAIAMANLAVYENVLEQSSPFVLMAECFEKCNELNRMFECFLRVEKLQGLASLEREFGSLYRNHEKMYLQVKGMIDV